MRRVQGLTEDVRLGSNLFLLLLFSLHYLESHKQTNKQKQTHTGGHTLFFLHESNIFPSQSRLPLCLSRRLFSSDPHRVKNTLLASALIPIFPGCPRERERDSVRERESDPAAISLPADRVLTPEPRPLQVLRLD